MSDQAPVFTGRLYVAPLGTQPDDDGWIDAGTLTGTLTGWHTGWHISSVTDAQIVATVDQARQEGQDQ